MRPLHRPFEAGTHRDVTLFNCFVMQHIEDSLASIFDALKDGP